MSHRGPGSSRSATVFDHLVGSPDQGGWHRKADSLGYALIYNLIERFFNKIKQCRRVATRYDKLAANYLAFVKLASIRIWLRANEATPGIFSRRLHFAIRMRPRRGRHPDSFAA
jgi:hypothetical protein